MPFFVYLFFAVLIYYLHGVFSSRKPELYVKYKCRMYKLAYTHLSFLNEIYRPPWWCQSGTLMTILRTFQTKPDLPWEREIVKFNDGGIAALDWLHPKGGDDDRPLLICLPGITGHTHKATYLWNSCKEAFSKGWRVLVINRRGLGVPLLTPKIAGADNTEDMAFVLENYVQPKYPKAKKMAVGFSMGGMVLINYLGSRNKENAIIDYGMSVSSPIDGHASSKNMQGVFQKYVLSQAVALALIHSITPYKSILKDKVDWDWVCAARQIGDFEHRCTARLNGYRDLNHYYNETAPYMKLDKIPVPFMVLCSEDDYFVPIEWMRLEEFEQLENVICVVTAHGGHGAFMQSSDINERGIVERALFEWAELHMENKD